MDDTLGYRHNFARTVTAEARQVTLAYDLDRQRWPWLALPPTHPVVLEKYQYFSSVTAARASGLLAADTYSALTRIDWRCAAVQPSQEHPGHGECRLWAGERHSGFSLATFDAANTVVCEMRGEGFLFSDRDFKAWRAKARTGAQSRLHTPEFHLAPAQAVGLAADGPSLVSPLREIDGRPASLAQIDAANGFFPAHPFHTGTGDHVNAGHLYDCALQTAHLLLGHEAGQPPLSCTGGAARFRRFVELDRPFSIALTHPPETGPATASPTFAISQAGHDNAEIVLHLDQSALG